MTKELMTKREIKKKKLKEGEINVSYLPDTDEFEFTKEPVGNSPGKSVRVPNDSIEQIQQMPDQFVEGLAAMEAYEVQKRHRWVYANSIESRTGYSSLIRVLGNYFVEQVAFLTSREGGSMSLDEAREAVYNKKITEEEAANHVELLLSTPTNRIGFVDLLTIHENSPAAGENLWELIKNEARKEFESGHRAASVFEPANHMKDTWNRACYLGVRESFCREHRPKGGIELAMIDAMAQAWTELQFWTEKTVLYSRTTPRREPEKYTEMKRWKQKADPKGWEEEKWLWEVPTIEESAALEQATSMADRWQRMFFRALRQLRDWRRYAPQVTINNPKQVNIGEQVNVATDNGQQINISNTKSKTKKKIKS